MPAMADEIDDKRGEPASLGDAPASGGVEEDREEFLRKCDTERDTLTPKETSDCAGAELADMPAQMRRDLSELCLL